MYRIGSGFDAHKFDRNKKLILGGVEIEYDFGLQGHSDADVLSHAICDAMLGAVNAGDIGKHFPDTDDRYKNISSLVLMKRALEILTSAEYKIVNIDTTVICERPKLSEYIQKIQYSISETLDIAKGQISVKATTTDKMGFTGRKEGIAAQAVILIMKMDEKSHRKE